LHFLLTLEIWFIFEVWGFQSECLILLFNSTFSNSTSCYQIIILFWTIDFNTKIYLFLNFEQNNISIFFWQWPKITLNTCNNIHIKTLKLPCYNFLNPMKFLLEWTIVFLKFNEKDLNFLEFQHFIIFFVEPKKVLKYLFFQTKGSCSSCIYK